jgi:antitoxin HicB
MKKKNIGSSLDDFLAEEGILEEAAARAQKKALAWQLDQAMKKQGLNKSEMARRMKTSRTQLDRLLDPSHTTVKLETIQRAAVILGKNLNIDLVDIPREKDSVPRKAPRL